jgi:hypothetical protein
MLSNASIFEGDPNSDVSTQHYIQTGTIVGTNVLGSSQTRIFNDATMSVTDAVISGGTLFLVGGTMNGDLSMEGGTFDPDCFPYGCFSILNGNFSVSSSSTYLQRIFSQATSSHLAVSGDATLAGDLDLSFFSCKSFGLGFGCVNFPDGATIKSHELRRRNW